MRRPLLSALALLGAAMPPPPPPRRREGPLPLPDLSGGTGLGTHVSTHFERELGEVVHVAHIDGGHSAHETAAALRQAKRELARVPEVIGRVTIHVDRHAGAALEAAEAKRKRRAEKAMRRGA